eukprot:318827-Amphidinium_carterae.1
MALSLSWTLSFFAYATAIDSADFYWSQISMALSSSWMSWSFFSKATVIDFADFYGSHIFMALSSSW